LSDQLSVLLYYLPLQFSHNTVQYTVVNTKTFCKCAEYLQSLFSITNAVTSHYVECYNNFHVWHCIP